MLTSGLYGYVVDYWLWWVMLAMLLIHTWCFFRFFPRKTYRKSGLVLGNGLIFLSLLGVLGIFGESYYRFVHVATDSFGVSLPARRWFALYINYNTHGFRDREWAIEKPAGVRRIAFVGDSFAFGWGVESASDRFTDLIQVKFESRDRGRVEILNVAKPGWGTQDHKERIAILATKFDVDEIVLCYVPNDIEKRLPRDRDFDPLRPPMPKLFDPDRSSLLHHLYRRIWVPRMPTVRDYHDWLAAGFEDARSWSKHANDLAEVVQTCRAHDVRLRVALLPYLRIGGTQFDARTVHQKVEKNFSDMGIPVADLLPAIEGLDATSLTVHASDAHPNESAHSLFADAIWGAFYEQD